MAGSSFCRGLGPQKSDLALQNGDTQPPQVIFWGYQKPYRFAKDVGKGKQLTTRNSTHNLFDQAQRAPKQMHDKQHGKAKGTVSGQASVRTIQHNMTAKTWSVILKHHDVVGEKKSKDKRGKTDPQNVSANSNKWNQKRFNHAQRKPKQKYEGQHGTEKGTILRRTSLKTSKLKQNDDRKAWGDISNCHDGVGLQFKETRQQRWHVRSEVIKTQNLTRDLSLHGWQLLRPRIQPSLW